MQDVYLISSDDRVSAVTELFRRFNTRIFHDAGVIIKANYNSADPPPGSTHPETLTGVIESVENAGSASITMIERSGMGVTGTVLEKRGVYALSREKNFSVKTLEEMSEDDFVHIIRPWMHWRNGFFLPKVVTSGNPVISVCCLKTHRFGGHFTMSLKNSVGLIAKREPGGSFDYMRELHSSPSQRLMIAEINTGYNPQLVILDATEGFVRGGPEQGELIKPGVIIAGTDRVAVDAVGIAILRKYGSTPEVMKGKIFGLEQIRRAAELGVGVTKPSDIRVKALDKECEEISSEIRTILENE